MIYKCAGDRLCSVSRQGCHCYDRVSEHGCAQFLLSVHFLSFLISLSDCLALLATTTYTISLKIERNVPVAAASCRFQLICTGVPGQLQRAVLPH